MWLEGECNLIIKEISLCIQPQLKFEFFDLLVRVQFYCFEHTHTILEELRNGLDQFSLIDLVLLQCLLLIISQYYSYPLEGSSLG